MRIRSRVTVTGVVAVIALAVFACTGRGLVLNELVEARATAADMRGDFLKAVEKSSQAVMAETDESSNIASHEAQDARSQVDSKVERLRQLLTSLDFKDDARLLDAFTARYGEYKTLDNTILQLAVENSNLKAQRLAFGPGREAVDALRAALNSAIARAPARVKDRADALASRIAAALLEVEVTEARHIAEPDDARMTEMEAKMMALEVASARDLDALQRLLPKTAAADLATADAALDRFQTADAELIELSRKNTNVRSLALTLGHKRTLAAACEDALTARTAALETHQFTGSR